MAIPRRAQAVPLARSADRPSFLADLPHVGEASRPERQQSLSSDVAGVPDQAAVTTHPAFAEIISLDRVGPPAIAPASSERHFLDVAHTTTIQQNHREEHSSAADQPMPQRVRSRSQQSGWRVFFSQAHTQLAPFAGLIVTLALLTSAGLLFWLISRGQPANFDLRDIEFNEGAMSVQLSESESSATPIVDTSESAEEIQEPDETTQAVVPVEKPAEPFFEQQAQTSQSNATTSASLGELSFPTTNTPLALDWSKAFESPTQRPSNELDGPPEIAEREDSSIESPVAR